MLALSVRQPYAYLILEGLKTYETRLWPTCHRGTIYIHASQHYAPPQEVTRLEHFFQIPLNALETGAILGQVDITDCHQAQALAWTVDDRQISCGYWSAGNYAWSLANPRRFTRPIYCRGNADLWEVPKDALAFMLRLFGDTPPHRPPNQAAADTAQRVPETPALA